MNTVIVGRDTVVEIQTLKKISVYKYSYRWPLIKHFVFGYYQREHYGKKLQLWWSLARVESGGRCLVLWRPERNSWWVWESLVG